MTFNKSKWIRLGSGKNINAYATDSVVEIYYYTGEYVGKKVLKNNTGVATADKDVKIFCSEFLPLGDMGVAVADGIFKVINNKGEE